MTITIVSIPTLSHLPTNSTNKNNLTFLSSFYGSEAVDITMTFTSTQNTAALWLSFKQTLLYPPDSLPLNVTFFIREEVRRRIAFYHFLGVWMCRRVCGCRITQSRVSPYAFLNTLLIGIPHDQIVSRLRMNQEKAQTVQLWTHTEFNVSQGQEPHQPHTQKIQCKNILQVQNSFQTRENISVQSFLIFLRCN